MPTNKPGARNVGYLVRFAVTSLILLATTLVLVLVVLPQRYVLSSGFREAGLNFPAAGIPFRPLEPMLVAARVPAPPGATNVRAASRVSDLPEVLAPAREPTPGPAELLWSSVLPLLDAGRPDEAVPLFEAYLARHPDDADVRRELASTLSAGGRPDEASRVLEGLLAQRDEPEIRIALARALRVAGRPGEASDVYRSVAEASPADVSLALEWARALAWDARYAEAEAVLEDALAVTPASVPLRVELARVCWYQDRLVEARDLLAGLTEGDLVATDAVRLRDGVDAALAPVERSGKWKKGHHRPTLLERAATARADHEIELARTLLDSARLVRPDDPDVHLALANLLEYELRDFAGAHDALLELERLGADTPDIQLRLADIEAWRGDNDRALGRLQALLPNAESPAEIHAFMGDLHRWNGERIEAAGSYRSALAQDADNARAHDGLDTLRQDVARLVRDLDGPEVGSQALGLADTDDFERLDLAGEWTGVRDPWSWGGAAGRRWMSGRAPAAASGAVHGEFVQLASARWWRWGTIRTSLRFGAEWVRPDVADLSIGAAVRYRAEDGGSIELDVAHEPAYVLTATLQSVLAGVTQSRVRATVAEPMGDRWSVAAQAEVARLDQSDVPGSGLADASQSTRLQAALTVLRTMTDSWSLGVSTGAATYSRAARTDAGLRLFWDPTLAASAGPLARMQATWVERWTATLRVNPALAVIDERGGGGPEVVPQLSTEAGVEFTGGSLRTSVDLFYSQARLEGYRTYGVRVSIATGGGPTWAPGG